MSSMTNVMKQALSLPVEERVTLAQKVWDSIEHFADSEVERTWENEADQRWQEIEKGKVKCLPMSEVMKRARKSLRRS